MQFPVCNYGYTLSEVPGKTALFVEFDNCQQRCKGCHSKHLWDCYRWVDINKVLSEIKANLTPDVNCILLMGGTNNGFPLSDLKALIEEIYKETSIPIALYSGTPETPAFLIETSKWFGLWWLKTGFYDEERGGLESRNTNQRLYEKEIRTRVNEYQNVTVEHTWENVSKQFWKRG